MKKMILALASILLSITTMAQDQGSGQSSPVTCSVVTSTATSKSYDKLLISGVLNEGEAFAVKTDGTATKVIFNQLTTEEFMKLDKSSLITAQAKDGQIGIAISVVDTSKISTDPDSLISPVAVAIGSDSKAVVLLATAKNLGAGCELAVSLK